MNWQEIDAVIKAHDRILISAHVNPDGDNTGAQLAMAWYCKSLGKTVHVYNQTVPPKKFRFLPDWEVITDVPPKDEWDVFIILDSSYPSRLGWDVESLQYKATINIDHHRDNYRGATVNYVDPTAAATSQLLWEFFDSLEIDYPPAVADALYTGIISDTGAFQFSNTNSRVLRIAADLLDRGANAPFIYKKLFSTYTVPGLALRAHVWQSLQYHFDGRFSSLELDTRLIEKMGADYGDTEGMSDQTLFAEGVEVGALVKYDGDDVHFSLRSAGKVDVGRVAQNIPGGGGHSCAAGCSLKMPLSEAKDFVFFLIEKALKEL